MQLSNKDIIIQTDNVLYHFCFLIWDSRFFGFPCYSLKIDRSLLTGSKKIPNQIQSTLSNAFVTAKLDTSVDHRVIKNFFDSGFQYIDTEIILSYNSCMPLKASPKQVRIKKMDENIGLPYEKLGSVFSLTRFHTDPNIKAIRADALWIEYLKNYIPDDNHHMFVAYIENEAAGVILANKEVNKVTLFFVAVRPEFSHLGIGSSLISHVVSLFNGYTVKTETQIKNINAMNFYIRNGFSTIDATKIVMHRW